MFISVFPEQRDSEAGSYPSAPLPLALNRNAPLIQRLSSPKCGPRTPCSSRRCFNCAAWWPHCAPRPRCSPNSGRRSRATAAAPTDKKGRRPSQRIKFALMRAAPKNIAAASPSTLTCGKYIVAATENPEGPPPSSCTYIINSPLPTAVTPIPKPSPSHTETRLPRTYLN